MHQLQNLPYTGIQYWRATSTVNSSSTQLCYDSLKDKMWAVDRSFSFGNSKVMIECSSGIAGDQFHQVISLQIAWFPYLHFLLHWARYLVPIMAWLVCLNVYIYNWYLSPGSIDFDLILAKYFRYALYTQIWLRNLKWSI